MQYSEMELSTYKAPEVDIISSVGESVLCVSGTQINDYEPTDLGSDEF